MLATIDGVIKTRLHNKERGMRLVHIAAAAAVILLSACAGPQERAARMIEKIGPYCEGLGYAKNTDAWRQCIQKEDARRTAFIMSDD